MSVYGLDAIVDNTDQLRVIEINGVRSGMHGFEQIYGDTRVQDQVYDMLREHHDTLTVNDGTYRFIELKEQQEQYRKEHPLQCKITDFLYRVPLTRRWMQRCAQRLANDIFKRNPVLKSDKANTAWINESAPHSTTFPTPFDTYQGQESLVLNLVNEPLPHETVNPYVTEEITRNKFLQYLILRDSPVNHAIPFSVLVGLGLAPEQPLNHLLEEHEYLVQKPILGSCGKGVQLLTHDDVQRLREQEGIMRDHTHLEILTELVADATELRNRARRKTTKNHTKPRYIEDLVAQNDFSFEIGVSLLQPFIPPKEENKYRVVRAIICNGTFVDAYQRIGDNFRVNLSQGAQAEPFAREGFDTFCEDIIATFEKECASYSRESFRRYLYDQYFEDIGRRTAPPVHLSFFISTLDSITKSDK